MKTRTAAVTVVLVGLLLLGSKLQQVFTEIAVISPLSGPLRHEILAKKSEKILFVSDQTGNKDIYLLDVDTKRVINLTDSVSEDMNPQLSPDGKSIVFYSNRFGTNQIYEMNLMNRKVTRLTNDTGDDYDPSYSPSGKEIVFKSTRDDGKGDIFLMNVDGTDERNLTLGRTGTEEWDPTFTRDGRIVFVVREGADDLTDELYSMKTDGSDIKRLTENDVPDWYPSINPVTGQILFVSTDAETGDDVLFTMNEDGTDRTEISDLHGPSDDPSWDSTGKKIVFLHKPDDNAAYDLYIMNADGSEVRKLLTTPSEELSPIFLP